MVIKVCDAIMGSGKSSAAINYMNSHPEKKFIYITPYLEEAERIRRSCPTLLFKEPNNKLPEFGFRKYKHTVELISAGENITSTHNMFLRYSDELVELIRKYDYTLIIDEAVDVLRKSKITKEDLLLFEKAGWTNECDEGTEIIPDVEYRRGILEPVVSLSKGNRLVELPGGKNDGEYAFYWLFSKELFSAFKEVFVLTYLFDSQIMKYYFDIAGIEFEKIGVKKGDCGEYLFSDKPCYFPKYTERLSEKIHIFDNDKLNAIGDHEYALSHSWFERTGKANIEKKEILRKNVYNFFVNHNRDKPASERLWATYKIGEPDLRGDGFARRNIAFNLKATNSYSQKRVLAYCVNIFMQTNEKNYFLQQGVDVKEDEYALSVMIQWIWRSAIRDGKEIWIYIPSKRMRTLLIDWIASVEKKYRDNIKQEGERNAE